MLTTDASVWCGGIRYVRAAELLEVPILPLQEIEGLVYPGSFFRSFTMRMPSKADRFPWIRSSKMAKSVYQSRQVLYRRSLVSRILDSLGSRRSSSIQDGGGITTRGRSSMASTRAQRRMYQRRKSDLSLSRSRARARSRARSRSRARAGAGARARSRARSQGGHFPQQRGLECCSPLDRSSRIG